MSRAMYILLFAFIFSGCTSTHNDKLIRSDASDFTIPSFRIPDECLHLSLKYSGKAYPKDIVSRLMIGKKGSCESRRMTTIPIEVSLCLCLQNTRTGQVQIIQTPRDLAHVVHIANEQEAMNYLQFFSASELAAIVFSYYGFAEVNPTFKVTSVLHENGVVSIDQEILAQHFDEVEPKIWKANDKFYIQRILVEYSHPRLRSQNVFPDPIYVHLAIESLDPEGYYEMFLVESLPFDLFKEHYHSNMSLK